jgi:hypothetical protein
MVGTGWIQFGMVEKLDLHAIPFDNEIAVVAIIKKRHGESCRRIESPGFAQGAGRKDGDRPGPGVGRHNFPPRDF